MHILHIGTERGWRGGENQIRLLLEGLEAQGHRNSLAYPVGSRALDRFSGAKTSLVPLTSTNPLSPKVLWLLKKYCQREDVDIIDAHSSKAHQLAVILKSMLPSLKTVVHRRVDNLPSDSWWTKRRYLSAKVDHYVAISEAIRQILIGYGVRAEKVSRVYSAIDTVKYESISKNTARTKLIDKYQLAKDAFWIGNASALSSQKGYEVLLTALARLKEDPSWHAIIAGEGELKESLKTLAQTLQIASRVSFIGFIDDVPEFLSAMDLVCIPSNNEGLGTLILDTLAAGTPVIASAVGGIPEIIEHDETGLLIPVGDDKALAEAIVELKLNPEMRARLVSTGQALIKEKFGLQAMVDGNIKIYNKLL